MVSLTPRYHRNPVTTFHRPGGEPEHAATSTPRTRPATERNHHVLHEAPFVPRAQRGPRDFPTADFWYLRNGKVEVFDCHIAFTTMFAQLGVQPDYASAVAASARTITPTGKGARPGV
jgi:hypothetical protein